MRKTKRMGFAGLVVCMALICCQSVLGGVTNLLSNPGFEVPDSTNNFADTSWDYTGTYIKREFWAARNGGLGGYLEGWSVPATAQTLSQDVATGPGVYTFELWVRSEGGYNDTYTHLVLSWLDADSNVLHAVTNDIVALPNDYQWHKVYVSGTCDAVNVTYARAALSALWVYRTSDPMTLQFDDAELYAGEFEADKELENVGFEYTGDHGWMGSRWNCIPRHDVENGVFIQDWGSYAGNQGAFFSGPQTNQSSYQTILSQNLAGGPGGYEWSVHLKREELFDLTGAQLKLQWYNRELDQVVMAETVTNLTIPADYEWHKYVLSAVCTNADLYEVRAQLQVAWDRQDAESLGSLMVDDCFIYAYDAAVSPDLLIRRVGDTEQDESFEGNTIYSTNALGQTRLVKVPSGATAAYELRLRNQAELPQTFRLKGVQDDLLWTVVYSNKSTSTDISTEVSGAGWLCTLDPGEDRDVEVYVNASGVGEDQEVTVDITCELESDNSLVDTARMITRTWAAGSSTPQPATWSTDDDYAQGYMNHVMAADDVISIGGGGQPLPFLWIPNSNEGTVSKINVVSGRELARYRVAPYERRTNAQPSRTTMDQYGNCWVANRECSTAIKIGLAENDQFNDRNGNGVMDTCYDVNGDGDITDDELLPWGEDECVLYEVVVIPGQEGTYQPGTFTGAYATDPWYPGPRGVAVDAHGNAWIGCPGTFMYYKINGLTGQIESTMDLSADQHKAYGAIVDANGILWSSGHDRNHVARIDPETETYRIIDIGHFVYGMGMDTNGNLFVSGYGEDQLTCLNMVTETNRWTVPLDHESRGITVSPADNDAWVICSPSGTVSRFTSDGVLKGKVSVGNGAYPTGGSFDLYGNLWVIDLNDPFIHRINPNTMEVELSKPVLGGSHYGYSDMTGLIAEQINNFGVWTVTHKSGSSDDAPWTYGGTCTWDADVPAGTAMIVELRTSNDQVDWCPWTVQTNGDIVGIKPGKFIQARVTLELTDNATDVPSFGNFAIAPAPDEDGDMMPDAWELEFSGSVTGVNPDDDGDVDGLENSDEYALETEPDNPDTDSDELSDGFEYSVIFTDPTTPDSDADGLLDGNDIDLGPTELGYAEWADAGMVYTNSIAKRHFKGEMSVGTLPLNADTDSDGLNDGDELRYGALPLKPDTDDDGASDGDEVWAGTDPTDGNSFLHIVIPDVVENAEGNLLLQWVSVADRRYTILRAPSLYQSFITIQTNIVATPTLNTYIDADWNSRMRFYYKIKCE